MFILKAMIMPVLCHQCSQLDTLRFGNERDGSLEILRVKHQQNDSVCQDKAARGSARGVTKVHELWKGGKKEGRRGGRTYV